MYYFCTYFDQHYLPRALTLYQSLKEHCPAFQLWMLCMDHPSYDALSKMNLPYIQLIALEDIEKSDEQLLSAKHNRTQIEYYFTCTPSLPLFILNNHPGVDLITYLDADLFFFSDPEPIYEEIADHSIAIIGHRLPPDLSYLEDHGIYNVGWLSFKRDVSGLACLNWWRERCIEWCHDRVEDGRFADQKYLDDWPTRFQNVIVLQHKGANLAPWNIANYRIWTDKKQIWVDEYPLIFFHFHALKPISRWLYNSNFADYKNKLSQIVRRKIYAPYIRTLVNVNQELTPFLSQKSTQISIRLSHPPMSPPNRVIQQIRTVLHRSKNILAGRYILIINGRII